MSGIMQVIAAGAETAPASNPIGLTTGVEPRGIGSTVHVNSASGDTSSGANLRVFNAGGSGGVPPYTYKWSRQNGTNKTVLENANGSQAYVSFSGMLVGEYQSTTANCRVRDSAGNEVTSSTIVIGIQRDS